ncbi:DUF1064 domain-containing protein [Pediococcus ethanolidurans]
MKGQMSAINRKGRKVEIDGYKFDSQREADFYSRYVKNCGLDFDVHPRFDLVKPFALESMKFRKVVYTPDFVVYDQTGNILHVYDVKNGFSVYDLDTGVQLRFKMFAEHYRFPVEVVVPRVHYFRTKIFGITKQHNKPIQKTNLNYTVGDLVD